VICGADGWVQIAQFGRGEDKWSKIFLALPSGVPSHHTFGHLFARLDPEAFEQCFLRWTADLATVSEVRLIAIDGKMSPGRSRPATIGRPVATAVSTERRSESREAESLGGKSVRPPSSSLCADSLLRGGERPLVRPGLP